MIASTAYMPTFTSILGQAEGLDTYLSLPKIAAVLILYVVWLFANQWVDRDCDRVKSAREMWNILVAAGGYGGIAILILFPWYGGMFFVGLAFWLVLAGGTLVAYVVHRNGRVPSHLRVGTMAHFRRIMSRSDADKSGKQDKGIRVKLIDSEGKAIERPKDVGELAGFDAAQDFIFDALWKRATDVEVVVGQEQSRAVYKIDGVAAERPDGIATADAEKVLTFFKRHAGLNLEETRRPQRGSVKVGLLGNAAKPDSVEVVTSGSTAGERLRLKVHRNSELMRLGDLGFMGDRLAKFQKLLELDAGLVLFAGPKESGVTTTQYAALRAHDAYMQNIYALETQPLINLDNITQKVHRGAREEVPFARMLQTVLRREPDVVMVGQCEDHDTAVIAAHAGVEKNIYVAIRAGNCVDAIARYMAMVGNNELVAKALVGVVAQRVIRKLCPACREAYKPDEQLLRKANLPVDKIENFYRPPTNPIVDKKGREVICQTCQSSRYNGQTGVFELLVVSDKIRKLIAAGASAPQIKAQARSEKMRYLQEEGLLKVIEGSTSMAEVMRGLREGTK